ncbi:hypothetical protein C8D97_107266 [Pleionea mediterranea]|uniref:Lipoprotein n=2 Tax=Pleionea mediterranea TaxID=523701 RepID=A0A316FNH9_9GAMM|nr:hypothetical protein C8D97_107266 [Pleionea mediterranea]
MKLKEMNKNMKLNHVLYSFTLLIILSGCASKDQAKKVDATSKEEKDVLVFNIDDIDIPDLLEDETFYEYVQRKGLVETDARSKCATLYKLLSNDFKVVTHDSKSFTVKNSEEERVYHFSIEHCEPVD